MSLENVTAGSAAAEERGADEHRGLRAGILEYRGDAGCAPVNASNTNKT